MSNASLYTQPVVKVYNYVELVIKLKLYILNLCNFYKNVTGQLSCLAFQLSSSEHSW